ncbi:nitrilase-related carbon-nitrogen hydrolase [Fibrobacter sp. UWEL]|uniref:nitrilase-related carbon-nitrogen hydrolase n=1 Tax=Fibrobacter sp. UWEL TaxID=1896209 RepID=UPI000910DC5D|nr:nitrilase-related carbon-nitrogen hydrolase [Fibrobacter sp. UWEL]SHK64213.1 Predicted amidohydrolase [Fibrobacter sp. UWEL]
MLDVLLVQMESVLGDPASSKVKNFDKVKKLLAGVGSAAGSVGSAANSVGSAAGCKCPRLILLPEMFNVGYIPQDCATLAETPANSETEIFLREIAKASGSVVLGAYIAKNADGSLGNHSCAILPDGNVAASYNKVHPFFPELKRGFAAGESVNLFEIGGWKIASVICYDVRFPELFRDAVKRGANLITVQAAWPLVRKEHWVTLLKARAIENQVYIAAVNGVSPSEQDPTKRLAGTSMLIDPQGNVITSGSDHQEEVIRGQVTLAPLEKYRQEFPVLQGIAPQVGS